MTPCFLADCTVRDIKQVAARGLMVDSPCPHIASHISVAKWAPVNQTFLFHNTILHRKTVPTDPSMVYVPCRHVTGHMPIARGTRTHTIIRFCTEASFPHSETVTACAAEIDLACACSAGHRLIAMRTHVLETLAFLRPVAVFLLWSFLFRSLLCSVLPSALLPPFEDV